MEQNPRNSALQNKGFDFSLNTARIWFFFVDVSNVDAENVVRCLGEE